MTAAALLDRLEQVRERGPGRWLACCPAHDDHNPSLSIAETSDGSTLIHCWSGCAAIDIVHALGLELRDLFPESDRQHHRPPSKNRLRISPADALHLLAREVNVIVLAAADLSLGAKLNDADHARLVAAASRINLIETEIQ